MQIFLNGRKKLIEETWGLIDLLHNEGYRLDAIAVAINHVIIPAHQYQDVLLKADIEIEIVTPMQGG